MKYSLKGRNDRDRHKNRIKRSGRVRLVDVFATSPPRDGQPVGTGNTGNTNAGFILWSDYRKSLPGQFIRIRLKIEQNCRLFLDIFVSAIINDCS